METAVREASPSRRFFMHSGNYKILILIPFMMMVMSCSLYEGELITRPDEFSRVYEAKEIIALRAVANVFREKQMGTNVRIDPKNHTVDSDYVISGDWRIKGVARTRKLNWKESEVTVSIITEVKTKTGWEMRRYVPADKYENLFRVLDLKIYEEMAKIE